MTPTFDPTPGEDAREDRARAVASPDYKGFARRLVELSWDEHDVGGGDIQDHAEKFRVIRSVPYDPAKHDGEEWGAEPGDPWYEFTDEP